MPTTRTRYVDPDVSGGAGNGTSWANAYSSLNAAEDAEDASGALTTSDEVVVFICGHNGASQSTADTTAVTFLGWTTDATRYIEIKTETADRHAGVWSATKYRLLVASATALTNNEDYVRIDGLQIGKSSSSASNQACITIASMENAGNVRLSNLILKQAGNNSYREQGIYCTDAGTVWYAWNCVVYGLGTFADSTNAAVNSAGTAYWYGCTFIGGYRGILSNGTMVAKNCYAHGSNDCYSTTGGTLTLTTCAASNTDGTADELDNIAADNDTFVDATNADLTLRDYRLCAGSPLIGVGTTLTDDPPGSTALGVDIAGTTRS